MKDINFLLLQLKTGGGSRVIIDLANQLANDDYNVKIIYPNISEEKISFEINKKIQLIKIGEKRKTFLNKIFNFILFFFKVNKLKQEKIILTDPLMCIFSFLFFSDNQYYRFIQADDYIIFDDLKLLKYRIILWIYKKLTIISYKNKKMKFIFNSKIVYERFLNLSNRKDVKFNLVYPTIDNKQFFNMNLREENKINLGIVARKVPWKGFVTFVNVIKNIDEKIKEKINKIYIISHDDLSEFDLNQIPNKKIIIPKDDKEICKAYNCIDIFISTSWFEGFGLPPLEALKCGCAVISSDSKGIDEYAVEGLNCLKFEPKNEKQLKELIEKLILNNKLRKKLQENSIESVKSFSKENSLKQFKKILQES